MPVTKSELMYLAAGLAIGGAVGANWSKIKPLLTVFLGPAAEGFQDAYGDLLGKLMSKAEAFQDASAERRASPAEAGANPKKKQRRRHKTRAKAPSPLEPFLN